MCVDPIEHQLDHRRTVRLVKGLGTEPDALFG